MSIYCINFCGEKIDYTDYTFSDGIKLKIPFDSNGHLHICPFFEYHPDLDDPLSNPEKCLSKEQAQKIETLDMGFTFDMESVMHDPGLLFRKGRTEYKTTLGFHSQEMPSAPLTEIPTNPEEYSFGKVMDVIIGSASDWPAQIPHLLILAYAYFMDGLEDDGKKCLEILEHSPDPEIRKLAKNEMMDALVYEHEESTTTTPYGNYANDVAKRRKNKDFEDNITEDILYVINDFEKNHLRKYVNDVYTKSELQKLLKDIKSGDISLYEKIKKRRGQETTNYVDVEDSSDTDYLDFNDCVNLIYEKIKQEKPIIIFWLKHIRNYRNLLSHPKDTNKEQKELYEKYIYNTIQLCIKHFEEKKFV
tara:strand:+ start:1028 stop:2110 length:1083 start_codon:yes stop_codon:yes gene_type:complete